MQCNWRNVDNSDRLSSGPAVTAKWDRQLLIKPIFEILLYYDLDFVFGMHKVKITLSFLLLIKPSAFFDVTPWHHYFSPRIRT